MNKKITINEIKIGEDPFLIAEIGLNHNNDINLTKKMIDAAKESGANAVKFQTYITEKLLQESSPAFSIFKNLELTQKDFKEISDYCKKVGIIFFSTPFSFESVDLLEELNVPCFKIASMDLNYYDFIRYIAKLKKPVILSTGMSEFHEIDRAVKTIEEVGNNKIIILHCISKYPPLYEEMNMGIIEKLKMLYPEYPIGFSDHSPDSTMAIVARTLGATVFEKHFTLDKKLAGPDHAISCDPKEFAELRRKLTDVDSSLSPVIGQRSDSVISYGARRSLFAAKNLKKGEVLTESMIDVVRPGDGLPPEYFYIFLGKELKKDLKKGDKLEFDSI